jgi:glycosyltransferase involved in cell wall biosynthesis
MKVLYDYQIFNQPFGGISRYFYNLINEFNRMSDIEIDLALKYTSNEHLSGSFNNNLSNLPFPEVSNKYFRKGINKIAQLTNKNVSTKKLKQSNFDIFHPSYYETYHIGKTRKPTILTVYDMIHEKFSQYFEDDQSTSLNKKELCKSASKILAISQSTKVDLIEIFDVPEEKVVVTPLAGGFEKAFYNQTVGASLPKRYVLFVGNRRGYKNFDRFFDAMIPLLKKDEDLHLVCTGKSFTVEEISKFNNFSLENQIVHRFPKDDEFYTYYNNALAFIFPTLYEGFGIPTLEALSSDCPAILSNTSSLPEVGGDAALYFDPDSIEDMRNVIEKVIYDNDLRLNMIRKGRVQSQKFTWEKTALMTKNVYKEFI